MIEELSLRVAGAFVVEEVADDSAVHVSGQDALAGNVVRDGDGEGVGAVDGIGFVGLGVGDTDFAVGEAEDDMLIGRPADASDGRALNEFVADHLLFAPRFADFVDVNDVVRLSDG